MKLSPSEMLKDGFQSKLVSLHDILSNNKEMCQYFQLVPEQLLTATQTVHTTGIDEDKKSSIFKVEVKTLQLSENKRQLLVISDITYILMNEKSKIKHNFQQQLTASLSHEQMTPLNAILNITDILQTTLENDLVN